MYVTQRSTDALTVQRGQEGTTAQAWNIGDLVGLEPTAGMLSQFLQPFYGTDTGATNAYVVSTSNAASSLYNGMPVTFITLNANTVAVPTLNVNGLGAVKITNADGSGLLNGQIPANAIIDCFYNANQTRWELQSLSGIAVTPAPGDNSTKFATTAFVQNALASYLPSGTTTVFYQASAPNGWTQNTGISDAAVRIVSGAGGGATGGNGFSSTFISQAVTGSVSIATATGTVGGTALTTAQLPAHNHGVNDPTHSHGVNDPSHDHYVNDPGHLHNLPVWGFDGFPSQGGNEMTILNRFNGVSPPTTVSTTGISLNASTTGIYLSGAYTGISIQNTGSNNTHTHSLTINPQGASFSGNPIPMNVKYIDLIICSKN
jgi:hypothetical protein